MSGLWCCNLGYSQQSIVDAVTAQLQELPYYNSFFQCSTPPAIKLSKELARLAPAHINNVFYTNSGSEGNDTVLRLVRRYWDLKEQPFLMKLALVRLQLLTLLLKQNILQVKVLLLY